MRLRAQKFLLFSFAFSSVLTLEIPQQIKNEKITSQSSVSSSTGGKVTENKTGNLRTLDIDHDLNKRSAEVFPEDVSEDEEKNAEKRAKLGFTGMRGKKEFSADDYCGRNYRVRLETPLNKRGFRSFNELLGGKRASLAFHGMRGKKSQDYDMLESDPLDSLPRQEFLIDSGLMDDPGETSEEISEEEQQEQLLNKRSPYAFHGMRGKKEDLYDLKRAMGFLGMKGKKSMEVWDSENNYKRGPQTSFFGMKGKKAKSSGFFGMRGKKSSLPNAFFGMKGKREPLGYDFPDFSLENQTNDSGSSRNRFRRGTARLSNSKKAKTAFFGMRGKKSIQESREKRISLQGISSRSQKVEFTHFVGNSVSVKSDSSKQ